MSERITTDMIDTYIGSVDLEASRESISQELANLDQQKAEFKRSLKCDDSVKDFIIDRIITTDTTYLEKHSHNPEYIKGLFKAEDGRQIHFDLEFDDPSKEIDFMRGFAIWLNTSEKMIREINENIESYQKEVDELHLDLDKAIYNISDNILNYIQCLRDQAYETQDKAEIDRVLLLTKYMESAYTMDVYREILEKHPGIVKNTIKDLNNESRVEQVGARYMAKLKRNNLHANLVQFASSDTKQSFEELHLLREDYEYKDLFVFSLIRFFSMADWDDINIRRLHATTYLVLRNMDKLELDMEVRKNVLDCIREYISMFK